MIYCFLANGFEEMEAISPVDILRRAGFDVLTVGIGNDVITGSHGISIFTDIVETEVDMNQDLQMIILPGGMPGTLNLERNIVVQEMIDYCVKNDLFIAAICAAPSILGHRDLLTGKKAICFPGFEEQLTGAVISDEFVVRDGNIITAKGAGVAQEFGLKLVEVLRSKDAADMLEKSLFRAK